MPTYVYCIYLGKLFLKFELLPSYMFLHWLYIIYSAVHNDYSKYIDYFELS